MMHFIQSHSDGFVAGGTGTVVSAATIAATNPVSSELISLLLPIVTGFLSGFAALAVKILLSIWYARRAQKKQLLLEQARAMREDEDVSNDTRAKEVEEQAKLIEAELQAITKIVDKSV